ncbi:hypothetical protein ACHAPI_011123 [Fusarium lateritium]
MANILPPPSINEAGHVSQPRTCPSSHPHSDPHPSTLHVSRVANSSSLEAIPQAQSSGFYGVTCHPHVVSPAIDDKSQLTCFNEGNADDDVDAVAIAVNIDLDPNSTHLRDQLLQSFFKYQTLWVDVVNKEIFLAHQAHGHDSRWYSKFLENAMLASSTRLSTSKSVRALGATFCNKAKQQVLAAMSEPTPANLQGFMLLSEYEVTQGNNRPGVACRMLSDLGLHDLVNVNTVEIQESNLAYALLSACIAYEGVWTLYLGRPSCIPKSFLHVVSERCRERRRSDSPWLNAWVGLCVPMADINNSLNDSSLTDAARCDLLRELSNKLDEWYEQLPPELTYGEDRLTSMHLAGYGLHTQFCKVQILVKRALGKSWSQGNNSWHSRILSDQDTRELPEHSQASVYMYALRIARLVVTYQEVFGLEKVPSILLDNAVVAATLMMEHLNKPGNEQDRQKHTNWLRQLVISMEAVQLHFPIVGRMLDTLSQGCGQGIVSNIFSSNRRASTSAIPHPRPLAHQVSMELDYGHLGTPQTPVPLRFDPDIAWEGFDLDSALGVLSSGGFDDSILGLPHQKSCCQCRLSRHLAFDIGVVV